MATYGEGDPTDNAQEFYDWLKDGGTQLEGLRYTVGICFMNGLFLGVMLFVLFVSGFSKQRPTISDVSKLSLVCRCLFG